MWISGVGAVRKIRPNTEIVTTQSRAVKPDPPHRNHLKRINQCAAAFRLHVTAIAPNGQRPCTARRKVRGALIPDQRLHTSIAGLPRGE